MATKTVCYNGKEMLVSDANARQRAMERQIRYERSQLVALNESIKSAKADGNNELAEDLQIDFENLSVKLKSHEATYKDFCKQTGQPELTERLQYPGFNRSISQRAVQADKRLYNTAKSVIPDEIMPKSIERFNKICYNPNDEMLKYLSNLPYEDAVKLKPMFNNRVVRSWYITHNKRIPDLVDKSLLIEDQAIQAFNLRQTFKENARSLMLNETERLKLDNDEPIKTFMQLMIEKSAKKQISGVELYRDIIYSSSKTRKSVNKKYGLE